MKTLIPLLVSSALLIGCNGTAEKKLTPDEAMIEVRYASFHAGSERHDADAPDGTHADAVDYDHALTAREKAEEAALRAGCNKDAVSDAVRDFTRAGIEHGQDINRPFPSFSQPLPPRKQP